MDGLDTRRDWRTGCNQRTRINVDLPLPGRDCGGQPGQRFRGRHDQPSDPKITAAGIVSTFAGSTAGYADGLGTAAQFLYPYGVAVDANDNVYVADRYNQRIRKITPQGAVSTIAGSTAGFADGNGANARFNYPNDLIVDASGNIFVADTD